MKQGTGKTRVALELAEGTDSSLVVFVVPNSLKKNMQSEIDKWGFDKGYLIETYEGMSMSDRRYLELRERLKKEVGNAMMICDESIFIKNDKSKRFQRLKDLSRFTEYRLLLNGTPLTRDEWDLYNQMNWLSPKVIDMDRREFLATFFKRHESKRRGENPRSWYEFSEVNADYLKTLIAPYTFYVDLNFDKEEVEEHYAASHSTQAYKEYFELKERLLEAMEELEEIKIYKYLSKMERVLFTDPRRLREISDFVKSEGQIIVFCRYVEEARTIADLTDSFVIGGSTPTEERDKTIKKFEKSDKPLVMTYGVGAYGLNLQFCNKIAFSSLTFDYGKVDQAKHRIKRIGQEKDIRYYYFYSDTGIYSMIEKNLERKESLGEIIKKGIEGGKFENL